MRNPATIVWLASFPKSGNTWFRIFLANLTAGEAGPADINDLDERGGLASSRQEFEAVTMLDSGLLSFDDIDCLRPRVYETIAANTAQPRWIKVHDAFSMSPRGEPLFGRSPQCMAVYLVRDPRDVAISLAYHHSTTIDGAIEMMNSAASTYCDDPNAQDLQLRQKLKDWSGHVTSWLDQTEVPTQMLRYEDLLEAPARWFGVALEFAGRQATMAEIERAVRNTAFGELQRQENASGFTERVSPSAPFFRTGLAGQWKERLSHAQICAIEQRHGSVMNRLGYTPLTL